LRKAKTRHAYYKDLLHELSDLEDVKRKLNMSVSDVEKTGDKNDDIFKSLEKKDLTGLPATKRSNKKKA